MDAQKATVELMNVKIGTLQSAPEQHLVESAKRAGADSYIEKPITVFSLMHVLKRLGRYELQILDRRPLPEASTSCPQSPSPTISQELAPRR